MTIKRKFQIGQRVKCVKSIVPDWKGITVRITGFGENFQGETTYNLISDKVIGGFKTGSYPESFLQNAEIKIKW